MTDPLTIVVIADPPDTLLPAHDSTVAVMEQAQQRGHTLLITTITGLRVERGRAHATCRPVSLTPAGLVDGHWRAEPDWYATGTARDVQLDHADIVLMRTDPPVDRDYLRATYLLDQVDAERVLMVNHPSGLREANEKLFTLRFPDIIPETTVTADIDEIVASTRRWSCAVLKPTDAMAGRGVFLLNPADPNLRSIAETATDRGRVHIIVQQFVPDVVHGDRRIIVLDGEPVGVIRRVATGPEFRCNMAAGASVVADTITARDKEICGVIAPELHRLGIVFAGIDVIGDRLTEVNVTSPTGVREIDALCGAQLARLVVERFEEHGRRRTG